MSAEIKNVITGHRDNLENCDFKEVIFRFKNGKHHAVMINNGDTAVAVVEKLEALIERMKRDRDLQI